MSVQPNQNNTELQRQRANTEEDIRILNHLARKVDFAKEIENRELGQILYTDQLNEVTLIDGKSARFPALNLLQEEYKKRYPQQIHGYIVGRDVLQAILDADDKKSIGATIYFGIFPDFEKTLPKRSQWIYRMIYWLQSLLPDDSGHKERPYESREPRQIILYATDSNGKPIQFGYSKNSTSAGDDPIKGTGFELKSSASPEGFIPDITLADRGGAEITASCPPN